MKESASSSNNRACAEALQDVLRLLSRTTDAETSVHTLNRRFGCPAAALEAGHHLLSESGLNPQQSEILSLLPSLARYIQTEKYGIHPLLNTVSVAADYLRGFYFGLSVEHSHILCLSENGRLIQRRLLQTGTVDQIPFYMDDILKCVVETGARNIILSHNHPGGTLHPSQNDIQCTLHAQSILKPLQVSVVDHIIAAGKACVSLRENGFLLPDATESALCQRWLQ